MSRPEPHPVQRRHTRRWLAVSCGAAALALAACSTTPPSSGASSGSVAEGPKVSGNLTVSYLSGTAYIPGAIQSFTGQNPGLKITTTQAQSNTYQPQIRAQLDAKHGPDVMFVWGGSGNAMATKVLAQADELADLSQSPWVGEIGPTANSLVSDPSGKVFALNSYQNPTGVVYDTEAAAKLGVKPPTTYSGMLDYCKTVSAKGVVPIALGAQTGYLATEVPLELANTLVYSKDPKFAEHLADGSVKWSTSELWKSSLTKALQQYKEMQGAGCFADDVTGYSDTAAIQQVASGKALGVDVISAAIPQIKQYAPNLKMDMWSLPATENPDDTVLTLNTGAAYGVAAASPNKDAATAFLNYMGQPAELAAAAAANYGLPYTPKADTPVPDEVKGVTEKYKAGKTALWQTNFWPGYQVKQTMIAECQNLLVDKQTVQGAVDAVQKSLGDS
ncbi:ABC transporter substrate-binding protein [Microlunatus flavus]|uniref:Raffinose/stachyose/melibiose transport system substrate-binding protein n=1 Tax=Microlunatus flavus TaxID=1036181 RepID=A0A1H9A8P9_9ACTN|nr:extracellular solute-binding protein [Microlunatus flavus]SEP73039.1 raffinose/stachyose/melibiose transport system substrate-binding protein [Microlunatus flavus]